MSDILLSVVVPSYNQAAYLRENLDVLVAHRHRGIEIIVLDGGSKDESADILRSYGEQLDYWVSEKDRGQAHAINKGLARAKGRWIAFQNSDDFYLPETFGRVLDALSEAQGSDLVLGGTIFRQEGGEVVHVNIPKPLHLLAFTRKNFINNQSLFVSSRLLKAAGLLSEELHFCLDYEWFLRLLKDRPKVSYIYEAIAVQRLHPDTKTSRLQNTHDEEFRQIRERFFTPRQILLGGITYYPYKLFRGAFGAINARLRPGAAGRARDVT